jgi:hypothetical protein
MAQHRTAKRTPEGKARTLARKAIRAGKYAAIPATAHVSYRTA